MTVVLERSYDLQKHLGKDCSVCKRPIYGFPFADWGNIFICDECCHKNKKDFTADLIHVAAIVDLQKIGYRGVTLVRSTEKEAEERNVEEQNAEDLSPHRAEE